MVRELHFILNETEIATNLPPGMMLLDFIRGHRRLFGTKIGCREGACGACTVLVGTLDGEKVLYRTMVSCLMPLGNAQGKHIVTIEGLNREGLTPIQKAVMDSGGTQCGFCTPGFVVSIAGFCLSEMPYTPENAMAAVDGNICRCTGYKSIERAIHKILSLLDNTGPLYRLEYLMALEFLPDYFSGIPARLKTLSSDADKMDDKPAAVCTAVGGGTDIFIQKPDTLLDRRLEFLSDHLALKGVVRKKNRIEIGGAATVSDLLGSPDMIEVFPRFALWMKLVSSTHVRNMATIAGNFVNASPIGDMSIFFLALSTTVVLQKGGKHRILALRNFFKGYKKTALIPGEILTSIRFDIPTENSFFNFEKVSRRTHLDIASVNSAMHLEMAGSKIRHSVISAGGVAPIPMVLKKASAFLAGKPVESRCIFDAADIAMDEIVPIDDIRGSVRYKKLLLRQLLFAHFHRFFPEHFQGEVLK